MRMLTQVSHTWLVRKFTWLDSLSKTVEIYSYMQKVNSSMKAILAMIGDRWE